MTNGDHHLIKRIARLVKEKNEILENNEIISKENQELTSQNEYFREVIGRISPDLLDEEILSKIEEHLKLQMVTVLFAGITGWDKLKTGTESAKIMDELDEINRTFDKIAKKYNIRKIKTIGDTFMYAGGVPVKNMTNPVDVVLAAIEMQNYIECQVVEMNWKTPWGLKIGIHTGPVSANVSGKKRKTYELSGDTVNIAIRLESFTKTNDIFISVATNEFVKEFFNSEYSGKIPVKYRGDLEIFKVNGILPELSKENNVNIANNHFKTRFGLLQFTDIQEIILDKLENELPSFLYYHNVKHTVDVVTQAELIGFAEGVSDEDLLILKLAALFHDSGHTVSYDNHEEEGCEIATKFLKEYGYSTDQINNVCRLIMATKLPPKPTDLLEKIMCDADLDYLGRIDMIPVSNTLFKELNTQNKINTLNDWNQLQVQFISKHQYFTNTAQNLREVNKQNQIERIKSLIQ